MLATFFIEIAYIIYILLRYKASHVTRLAIAILFSLAIFQLAEYFICERPEFGSEIWARAGFIAITALLPLGIHFIYALGARSWDWIIGVAYGTALAWVLAFSFIPGVFNYYGCSGNYAIFYITEGVGDIYFLYYYFWLYAGVILSLKYSLKINKKRQAAKQSLMLFMVAYLGFLVPTTIVNAVKPETMTGIPSIMCGFAVIMATIITFMIIPRMSKRENQDNKKPVKK